jgi:hypothetical protein
MAKWVLCSLPLMLTAGGCQKLDYSKTFDLQSSEVHELIVDPPSRDQTVKIVANSKGVPISVYLVLEKDAAAAKNALMNHRKPDLSTVLASKDKAEEVTIEGRVPAKNGYVVLVGGANKPTKVDLKITAG